MATHPQSSQHWTLDEYLALEANTGIRHEYLDGDVYAMSGGSAAHSKIIYNIVGALFPQLRGSDCGGYDSNMQIYISELHRVYPDVSVVCGEPIFTDDTQTRLTNPTLVVEVISPSSEQRDRVTKLDLYRRMSSVQAYLLVEQSQPRALLYTRQADDSWLLRDYIGREGTVPLPSIGCTLPLRDVYDTLNFDET